MRIKFLAIIAGFLFVSIAISSCLDSDDNMAELSSDATVHAFGLDTIYGKHYQFTIDQLNRVIYNQDSLPVGADTIIDRILIDTFTVSGWITAGINDTLFNKADSVDLTSAVNNEGMKFKVHAPDGSTYREYTLKINRHKLDPDSLVWKEMETFTPTALVANVEQKAVVLGEQLFVFTNASDNTAYQISTNGESGWQPVALTDFPTDAKLNSIVNFKKRETNLTEVVESQKLYVATNSGKVYSSDNGSKWTEEVTLGNVVTLVTSFSNSLVGIIEEGDTKYFKISKDGLNWEVPTNSDGQAISNNVPVGFPLENIYSTLFSTVSNIPQVMVVGQTNLSDATLTAPWFSMNGVEWTDMSSTAYDTYCPIMNKPVCMYYGSTFYIFGSKDANKLDAIYSSVAGLAWYKTERKFLLPKEFKDITSPYSIVIDNQNYIWIIFGGNGMENAVWRGRLNKLGFIIQ